LPGTGAAGTVAKWRTSFLATVITGMAFLNDGIVYVSARFFLILTRQNGEESTIKAD
jgi:hypothetical protein